MTSYGAVQAVVMIAALCGALILAARPLDGQGIATASVRGSVQAEDGAPVDDGRMRVLNLATGFASEASIRRGRFLVQGLEVGGPYVAEVRKFGYVPQRSGQFLLRLGEPAEIHFVLQAAPAVLETVCASVKLHCPRVAVPRL